MRIIICLTVLLVVTFSCKKKDDEVPKENFISFYLEDMPWESASYTAKDSLSYFVVRAVGKDNSRFGFTVFQLNQSSFQLTEGYYSDNFEFYKYNSGEGPNTFEVKYFDPGTRRISGAFSFPVRYRFDPNKTKTITIGQFDITYGP